MKPGKTVPLQKGRYEKIIRNCGNDIDGKCCLRPDIHRAGCSAESPPAAKTASSATRAGTWRGGSACSSRRQSAANVESVGTRSLWHRATKRGRQAGGSRQVERH